jgi:predicted DNA-binding transcriptional regulator YafY
MFGGQETEVKMEFSDKMVGVVIDRFGRDIMIIPSGEGRFRVTLKVAVSNQFLGWVFALGTEAEILWPERVREQMKQMAQSITERY